MDEIATSCWQSLSWPIYQYVQGRLALKDIDIDTTISSLPRIEEGVGAYAAVRPRLAGYRPEDELRLTAAGLAHAPELSLARNMFVAALRYLVKRRLTAVYSPREVLDVVVPGAELEDAVSEIGGRCLPLLRGILEREPGIQVDRGDSGSDSWLVRPSPHIHRLRGVETTDQYLARLRNWLNPPVPESPVLTSPLAISAAIDYLEVVWRLETGGPLFQLPTAERLTRLAFPVGTMDELADRLTTLGEVLKGMRVPGMPGGAGGHALQRLVPYLKTLRKEADVLSVQLAKEELESITKVRNAMQHSGAVDGSVAGLTRLGIPFPIPSPGSAWDQVTFHFVKSINDIRDFIQRP